MTAPTIAIDRPVGSSDRPSGRSSDLAAAMSREWAQLRRRRAAIRHAAGWGIVEGSLSDLDQVLAAIGHHVGGGPVRHPAERARADEERLRRLVLIAADDELAGRVIVQRLLPGLLALLTTRGRRSFGPDALGELVGASWIEVRTFNPARRPACLAAALIADSDYRAFRSACRRRSSTERPVGLPADRLPERRDPTASEELAELLQLARESGVADADLRFVRQMLDHRRLLDLAAELDVTPRTIRNRRDRIATHLRAIADAAA